jgi:hypothetical protein
MAKFVRLSAEFFDGITYWGEAEYYEAGPGHVHVTDHMRDCADYIAPGAETSLQGVHMRESGEHGGIWLPCPPDVEFITDGPLLASVQRSTSKWDLCLQPTLSYFFSTPGAVFPLHRGEVEAALWHKIPAGSCKSVEDAVETLHVHAASYDGSGRRVIP